MIIQILIDNPNSWYVKYGSALAEKLNDSHQVKVLHRHEEVERGDILILLSCEKIFRDYGKNKYNLVCHASDLPSGKGWSPLTWQILEGKNEIPITLFEAADGVDEGDYYIKDSIAYNGTELIEELRVKLAEKISNMFLKFVTDLKNMKPQKQEGEEFFYKKRKIHDSRLDINKTIIEQFNLFRVVDNERYPAFFEINGKKYILKIYNE
jgi:methionyl-tRNA formyltransferase